MLHRDEHLPTSGQRRRWAQGEPQRDHSRMQYRSAGSAWKAPPSGLFR